MAVADATLPRLKIVTGLDSVIIQDFDVDNSGTGDNHVSINPNSTDPVPIVQGEWLCLVGSTKKLQRMDKVERPAGGSSTTLTATNCPPGNFLVWSELGRSDIQAIDKVSCIVGGSFLADLEFNMLSGSIAAGDRVTLKWDSTAERVLCTKETPLQIFGDDVAGQTDADIPLTTSQGKIYGVVLVDAAATGAYFRIKFEI